MTIWGSSAGFRSPNTGYQEWVAINADVVAANGGYSMQARRSYGQAMDTNINSTSAAPDVGNRVIAYSVRPAAGGNAGWRGTIAGNDDGAIRSLVRSFPAGQKGYIAYNHEPENDGGEAIYWRQACARFAKVVLDEGNPNVVPVFNLMAYTWNPYSGRDPWEWNPGRHMSGAEIAASVGAIDGYAQSDPTGRSVDWLFTNPYNDITSWGFRFGIYECGCDEVAGRTQWILDLEDWVLARDSIDIVLWWHSQEPGWPGTWLDGDTGTDTATVTTWAGVIGRNQGADIPAVAEPVVILPDPGDPFTQDPYDPTTWGVSDWQEPIITELGEYFSEYLYSNQGPDGWAYAGGNISADFSLLRWPAYSDADSYGYDSGAAECSWHLAQVIGGDLAFYDGSCPTTTVSEETYSTGNPYWVGYSYYYDNDMIGQTHEFNMEFGRGSTGPSSIGYTELNDAATPAEVYNVLPANAVDVEWEGTSDYGVAVGLSILIEWETTDPSQTQSVGIYLAPPGGIPAGDWLSGTIGVEPSAPGVLLTTVSGTGSQTIDLTAYIDDYITYYTDEFTTGLPEGTMYFYLIDPETMGSWPGVMTYPEDFWGPAVRIKPTWQWASNRWRYYTVDEVSDLVPYGWGSPIQLSL